MLNVILVDDHPIFRKGLAAILETYSDNIKVVGSFGNGKELLDNLNELPDVIIMDIQMPVMDAFATMDELKKRGCNVPILILSMVQEEKEIVKMMTKGIRGFLPKDSDPELFISAIEEIQKGGFYIADSISGILNTAFAQNDKNNGVATNGYKGLIPLTEKEIEFIRLACSELTYKEIAEKLCLSVKTIDGYRASIFEKLDVKSRPGLVLFAVKYGIFEP